MEDESKLSAQKRLEDLGWVVTFGKHVNERDKFDTTAIWNGIVNLHEAFADDSVQLVITVIGDFNGNQLLRCIDYDLICCNPKILWGRRCSGVCPTSLMRLP